MNYFAILLIITCLPLWSRADECVRGDGYDVNLNYPPEEIDFHQPNLQCSEMQGTYGEDNRAESNDFKYGIAISGFTKDDQTRVLSYINNFGLANEPISYWYSLPNYNKYKIDQWATTDNAPYFRFFPIINSHNNFAYEATITISVKKLYYAPLKDFATEFNHDFQKSQFGKYLYYPGFIFLTKDNAIDLNESMKRRNLICISTRAIPKDRLPLAVADTIRECFDEQRCIYDQHSGKIVKLETRFNNHLPYFHYDGITHYQSNEKGCAFIYDTPTDRLWCVENGDVRRKANIFNSDRESDFPFMAYLPMIYPESSLITRRDKKIPTTTVRITTTTTTAAPFYIANLPMATNVPNLTFAVNFNQTAPPLNVHSLNGAESYHGLDFIVPLIMLVGRLFFA